MATHKVKKVAVSSSDIGGLKSSRYEKLQASYGVIPAFGVDGTASYASGDSIVFNDVPSKDIIRATVIAHDPASPTVLEVYPGSDKNSAFTLNLASGVTAPVELSYIIEYVRGTGRVGTTTGDNSGEGDLFTVVVQNDSGEGEQVGKQAVKQMTTTQFASLNTVQLAALELTEIPTLTTKQLATLNSTELKVLNTAQLQAFDTKQVASLTTVQTSGLSTSQLAALQS